jgi:hypothetical protein
MGRRLPRRYVLLGLIVLTLVAVPVAATEVRWSGSLGYGYGNAVSIPMRVGESVSVGMTTIRTGRRVRIESVRLHGATGGVVLAGALLGQGGVGTAPGFPPSGTMPLRAAEGAVIPAHANLQLVVGLRATDPGTFRVRGIDVRYLGRWHGVDLRRRTHTGLFVYGCVVPRHARLGSCRLPPVAT